MDCSPDEAVALLNKWHNESTQVLALLTGTIGPLDSSVVGIKFSTFATVDGCDDQGLQIKWPPKGRFFLVFKGVKFQYSEPRDIPPEIIQQAGGRVLVGTLQILLPFGLTFVICEVGDSPN
jgi:hypothetical protein